MDNWPPLDADTAFPNALDLADNLDQTLLDELFRNDANTEQPLVTQPQDPQPQFSSGDIGPQLNAPATLSNANMDTVVNPAFGVAAASQNSPMSSLWDPGFQQGYNINSFAVDASLWPSAPLGRDLSIHPDVIWGLPAWATPLGALGAHDTSNYLAQSGLRASSGPGRAG
ncbi:hypothetical protein DIS24_g8875 [Lasiodiplodia hormozganensis]|uniref:Uncharacterized protein n=1 Tax=Lasiodiplodia hormozganensis TaxID=869390 RepID=A0AA40CL77_9PEZI|nr:hypothetical protein DIS24_g8875 [Lasiodiplodia hormozganensis]